MTSQRQISPPWIPLTLRLAAVYNLLWGLWVVLAPQSSFALCGYPEPVNYPELWQCIGMIVGVYGIGYWLAAADPVRHWPIVLVGLLGKVFGPLGFLSAWIKGSLPLSAGRTIVFNDLIWWIPFALILWKVFRLSQSGNSEEEELSFEEALGRFRSQTGRTLRELSAEQPILVVFLRHLGCTFCREALADLRQQRKVIEDKGTQIALVHMSENTSAGETFSAYGLGDLPRFSDPSQQLYRAFGLSEGRFSQLLGPRVFWRGFTAAILQGHGFGPIQGNGFRMPGAFLLHRGKIIQGYRHATAADRPDYCQLSCSLEGESPITAPDGPRTTGSRA